MKSLRILVTAGPTVEPIDPVRFLSNHSTGLIGYEIARLAKQKKHKVTLISGPTYLIPPTGIKVVKINTALELQKNIKRELKKSDVLIMTCAVSDYRPATFSKSKIKSGKLRLLKLLKNPDILKSITKKERKNKIFVGFSIETTGLLKNSAKKLKEKGLDLVVANAAGPKNDPFGGGPKTVFFLDASGGVKSLKNAQKTLIARRILDRVSALCYTSN